MSFKDKLTAAITFLWFL